MMIKFHSVVLKLKLIIIKNIFENKTLFINKYASFTSPPFPSYFFTN